MSVEKIKLKHNSPEWLAFRRKGIGASDAAAVLGLSKWITNVELWEEKVGLRQPKNLSDNEHVRYGTAAETPLVKLFALQYADKYKVKVDKQTVYLKDGFQFASLDGELTDISSGELGIYEGKTVDASASAVWENWKGKVPQQYYVQVLHQMLVTGRTFDVLNPEFRWKDENGEIATQCKRVIIRISDLSVLDDMKYLDEKEREFWECVKSKRRPPLLLPQI